MSVRLFDWNDPMLYDPSEEQGHLCVSKAQPPHKAPGPVQKNLKSDLVMTSGPLFLHLYLANVWTV